MALYPFGAKDTYALLPITVSVPDPGTGGVTSRIIRVFGNSLQTTYNDPTSGALSVPQLLGTSFTGDSRISDVVSYAVAGATLVPTGNGIRSISERIDDYLATNPATIATDIHILEGGINDAVTTPIPSAQTIYDRQKGNIAKLYAAGARIILVDGLTSATGTYGTISSADLLALKAGVNQLLRSNVRQEAGVVGFLDSGSFPEIGADDAGNNTTYFLPDKIHYTDTGRRFKANNVYRPGVVRALNGETGFIIAGQASNGNTTPIAPSLQADDTANTLSASHALGDSEILMSVNNGAYTAYAGPINVGDVNRPAGYWKFKTRAATGRNESVVASSPQFTAGAVATASRAFLPQEMIYGGGVGTSYNDMPAIQKSFTNNGDPFIAFNNEARTPAGTYVMGNNAKLRFTYLTAAGAQNGELAAGGVVLPDSAFTYRSDSTVFDVVKEVPVPAGTYSSFSANTLGDGNFGYFQKLEIINS